MIQKTIVLIISVLTSIMCSMAFGQEEFTRYKNQDLKKKKDGWGIKKDGQWSIPAEYDRIIQSGFKLLAWKGNKIDVYRQFYLNLLFKDISIHDTSFLFSFTKFEDAAHAFSENQQWGWKYKDKYIAANYDSIRMISEKDVRVYQKGKTAVLSKEGELMIPLNNYDNIVSFPGYYSTYKKHQDSDLILQGRFDLGRNEIPPIYLSINIIQEDRDVYYGKEKIKRFFEAKRITGEFDYYDANSLSRLPDGFVSVYSPLAVKRQLAQGLKEAEEKKKIAQIELRATLRVFRDGNKGLGLVTSSGRIFMPAGLAKINYRTISWVAKYGGKGLTRTEYTLKDGKKTISSRDYDEDTAMLYIDKGLASFPLKIAIRNIEDYYVLALDHDYRNTLMLSVSCRSCQAGKITAVVKDEYTTKEIAPAFELKETGQMKSLPDKYGRVQVTTYTTTKKFDAITETTKKTKQISPEKTCSVCKGSGLTKIELIWNEQKSMYEETYAGH